jgi:hypothetical protein
MTDDDSKLDRILAEVVGIRLALERDSGARLAALLVAIAGNVGEKAFSASELCMFANSKLAGAAAVKVALDLTVGDLDAGAVRRVGKLLAKGIDVDVLGLTVKQIGTDREGRILRVSKSDSHTRRQSCRAIG